MIQTEAPLPPEPKEKRAVAAGTDTPAPAAAPAAPVAAKAVVAQTPPARRVAPRASTPPRQVVTVVHRLSGWKLLNWLASSGPPSVELDDLPSTDDVHTNIVAGYISEDGRTVVARLPRAEVGLDSFPAPPPGLLPSTVFKQSDEHEYTIVTADGMRADAKFVGLDASTGLSLLESNETLFSGAPIGSEGDTDDPIVGQLVRLYAPAPAPKAATVAGASTVAEDGYIYLSIDRIEGRLTEVKRAPSGRLASVVARADVPPEWVGAVAADDSGDVVGIVSQSVQGETRIVPVETIRSARERVLGLRASAPQPWLGARGDAAFRAPLETWVGLGWKPEFALPHIQNRQGVFLTSVAPGTPAALAGLRPGDVIARVGARDVRSVEDLSFSLKDAGVGSLVDFTVWRALEQTPLKLSVQLKGAQNPALATAEAEERAARASLATLRREAEDVKADELRAADMAALTQLAQRLQETQQQLDKVREQIEEAEARVAAARVYVVADPSLMRANAYTATPLQTFGLNAVSLNSRGASRLGASRGLLVVAVRPDSPCAASGLRAGDLIETLNGSPFTPADFGRLVSAYETTTPITLGLVREGRRLTLNVSLALEGERQK
ncbi:MAG TPA: PDZ domain-containing protein [Pyrinomonadaceae bacterium]|nr:PDZ domain-containing protein [Pyrinomonadaceae bacterium]